MNADTDKARADITWVRTVEEFVGWTQDLDGQSLLYRGLADSGWQVESAAYRRVKKSGEPPDPHEEFKNHIVRLLEKASMRGLRAHAGGEFSDLELLAQLQHYGAATCLIDFTYSPLVALWFACSEQPKKDGVEQAGKVVAMDTVADAVDMDLIKSDKPPKSFCNIGEKERREIGKKSTEEFVEKFVDGKTLWTWEPLPRTNRVIAQQSIFVFGKAMIENRYYEEVRVPSSAKEGIISALRAKFGVTEENLFGDFAGFALANAHDRHYKENTADYYYGRAVDLYYQRGRYEKALQYCDKAIAADSQHVKAHYWRGRCNAALRNFPEADVDISRAIQIDPMHIDSIFLLAVLYTFPLKKQRQAIDAYTRIIESAPNSAGKITTRHLVLAHHRRGLVKAMLDGHVSALEDFASAIDLDPENTRIYRDRAKSLRALGREIEAQADEKKVAELDPELRESNPTQNAQQ